MNTPTQSDNVLRQDLLDQIASITTMRLGTLAEEYREHPSPDGGTVRLGPYFKHQVWQDGRNVSRRVPVAEAATLKLDTEEAKRFHQLTEQLAQLNIQHTIALRTAEAADAGMIAEKKPQIPMPRRKIPRNRTLPRPSARKAHPKRTTTKPDPMVRDRPARRLRPRRLCHRRGVV
jgi:hypothetical protein